MLCMLGPNDIWQCTVTGKKQWTYRIIPIDYRSRGSWKHCITSEFMETGWLLLPGHPHRCLTQHISQDTHSTGLCYRPWRLMLAYVCAHQIPHH